MDDLISKKAAIDALNEYFARIGKLKRRGLTKGEKAISLDTVGVIKTLPTAEPKMGRWIYKNDLITVPGGYWECSECKEGRLLYEANFCPNCGSYNGGEQDE